MFGLKLNNIWVIFTQLKLWVAVKMQIEVIYTGYTR